MSILFSSVWPCLTIWVLLYISDYALTITCARLYLGGVNEKIILEGSYEITPFFQRDIDSLRRISPRFVAMLFVSTGLLGIVGYLTAQSTPELYVFASGALILLELTVHIRHLRNLSMFRAINKSDCVRGRIEYSRPFMLRMSSHELFIFSAFFSLLFVSTRSWFVLGGAVACLAHAMKHRRLAQEAASRTPVGAQSEPAS